MPSLVAKWNPQLSGCSGHLHQSLSDGKPKLFFDAEASAVARDWLGDTFVDHFAATREWEHRQWQDAVTDWELKRYFEII